MLLDISWKKWFEHTHWSVGHCPRCHRPDAIRVGRILSATYVYHVVRIETRIGDVVTCCDYCGAAAEPYEDADYVEMDDWSYRDGLRALFNASCPQYDYGLPRLLTHEELKDFLVSVTWATRFTRVDLNEQWLIPLIGGVIGSAVALTASTLTDSNDTLGAGFLAFFGGGIVGGLLGVLLGGLRLCGRNARSSIEYAAFKYRVDRELLSRCAGDFPPRIRRAVSAVVRRG